MERKRTRCKPIVNRIPAVCGAVLLVRCLFPAGSASAADLPPLLPRPAAMEAREGHFSLDAKATLSADAALVSEAAMLSSELTAATGLRIPAAKAGENGSVRLRLDPQLAALGDEGYRLAVSPEGVEIAAPKTAGIFYGGKTLLQLLPDARTGDGWRIPCVAITDQPRFAWRGLMLDCSRTFQSLDYLHKTVDRLAAYKMNVLHLHLTDDQGWRLEIKKYPELTQTGARFAEKYKQPESMQGFYTQQQMRELVAYAAARHVTIVPEIELPGHSLAALACYPQLSCTGGPFEIFPHFKGPGIVRDLYCAGNDATFEFFDNVFAEVAAIFPSKFIHTGGDEAPKDRWKACPKCQARLKAEGLKNEAQLHAYVTGRAEKTLEKHGRRLIGWDAILHGGLAADSVVMSWRGMIGGIAAAKAGHDVVMSPTSHCYFDYPYKRIDSELAYSFEPVPPKMTPDEAKHILGLQANFWSHIDRTPDRVDQQLFPRLLSLAERGWSPKEVRDWNAFKPRLDGQLPRLTRMGIHYYTAPAADVSLPAVISGHMVLQREQNVPIWGTAAPGETVTVKFRNQQKSAVADPQGKWLVKLDPLKAGGPDTLTVAGKNTLVLDDVLVGEVWLGSGQSNMGVPAGGAAKADEVMAKLVETDYPQLRLKKGDNQGWQPANPTNNGKFSALLLAFGVRLQQELDVPVGLMTASVGGTPSCCWLSREAYETDTACKEMLKKSAATNSPEEARVGNLYERYIRPFIPYGIRGVLWDQGEAQAGIVGIDQYTMMGALIRGWRKDWGQGEFPFLYVQKYSGGGCAWDPTDPVTCKAEKFTPLPARLPPPYQGLFRENFIRIMQYPNTAMVTASDLGGGIHPVNKSGYGSRAARVALGMVYGRKLEIYGPLYQSHQIEGDNIRVKFAHIGQGLAVRHSTTLQGFTIAGDDKVFHWADAKIDGDTVVVSSPKAPKPTAVRYAWASNCSWANLFNKDGLPALTFRTESQAGLP